MPENDQAPQKIDPSAYDETDRKIAMLLNKDGRMTLKEIAQEVGISIDTVKRRMERMLESGAIMKIVAIPEPLFFGYPLFAHVYIKFQNMTEEKAQEFVTYTKKHPRIALSMSMFGEYDMYLVIYSKGASDLHKIKNEIRSKFSDFIADWKEMMVAELHKYEEYVF